MVRYQYNIRFAAAPRLWNSLPETVKLSNSLGIFKNSLKTHLHKGIILLTLLSNYVMLLSFASGCFLYSSAMSAACGGYRRFKRFPLYYVYIY